jgi:hypothetical protein
VALSVFGAGAVADAIEGLAGDALPDWAKAPNRRRPKAAQTGDDKTDTAAASQATAKERPPTSGGNGINDPI